MATIACILAIVLGLAVGLTEAQTDSSRGEKTRRLSDGFVIGLSPSLMDRRLTPLDGSPLFRSLRPESAPEYLPFLPIQSIDSPIGIGFYHEGTMPLKRADIDFAFDQYRLNSAAQARAMKLGALIGGTAGFLVGATWKVHEGDGSTAGQRAFNALIGGSLGMLAGQAAGLQISTTVRKK